MSAARDHWVWEVQAARGTLNRATDAGGPGTDLRSQFKAWAEDQGAARGGQSPGTGQPGDLVRTQDADRVDHTGWVSAEEP
jgi:hypothetical protein